MSKIKPPFEILVCFANRGKGEKVVELLKQNEITNIVQLMGKGTTSSEIADLFGFGVTERDVVACFVKSEKGSAMVETIYTDAELNINANGVVFTIQPSSAAANLLSFLNLGVNNGKKS